MSISKRGRAGARRQLRVRWALGLAVGLLLVLPLVVLGGDGNFTPHPTTPSIGAGGSTDVALGDLDGDGDLDAVVANDSTEAETVWLNGGSGNFTPHPTVPSFGTDSSYDVALGDLDDDDDLDAVVSNGPKEPETVWFNDGSGNFMAHPTVPSFGAGDSFDVALGDLDGDGDLDAVVANDSTEAETVWLNDGSGSFTPHPTSSSFGMDDSYEVALGDLEGDGDLDAVVANYNQQSETVWLNDGSGSFTAHPTSPSFGADDSHAVALGDLDDDGIRVAIVANYRGEADNYQGQAETVWLNSGTAPTAVTLGAVEASGAALPHWGWLALGLAGLAALLRTGRRAHAA
jgi:hypothetical protein